MLDDMMEVEEDKIPRKLTDPKVLEWGKELGAEWESFDKPRKLLYKLARSKNVWERRTAIVSTWYFIRQGDIDDTFQLAEVLLSDGHDLIHKAAGGWLREAGKHDRQRLLDFLNKHAAKMPRTFLRYAIEHLDKKTRDYYLGLRKTEK